MPGARCARSLACKIKKHTSIVTTVTPKTPGIPYAMVLTVSFVISPVIGLSCHRRQQFTTCQLDASVEASGPHDFAVRLQHRSSAVPSASIASRAYVRDDRDTPLMWDGMARLIVLIWVRPETEYFCKGDWTAQISLIRFNKFRRARRWRTGPGCSDTGRHGRG